MNTQIPLIDISDIYSKDYCKMKRIADEMGEAARHIGFFMIKGHHIDLDLIEATYQSATAFFALSDPEKRRCYIGNSTNHRGYVPFTEKGDYADEIHRNYEAFDLGQDLPASDPDYIAGRLLVGPNIWPQCNKFKSVVGAYFDQISQLGHIICAALEVHLNVPKGCLTQHMSKPISQLRLLHYVRDSAAHDKKSVNMGAHTDYECLTLLHTRNKGLQVMAQSDDWIEVPVHNEAYVINIGDMLEAWTNGVFRSTPHRVLNLSAERFSLPYFVAPNFDTKIIPLQNLVSKERPAKYDAFFAGDHLTRMLLRDFPYLKARQPSTETEPIENPFESRLEA